ncbi:MAG: TonB-dependent receptor [Prolixibacteraceae bacterium]
MKLKNLLTAVAFMLLSIVGMTQTGVIRGTIADANTKETLIGATVALQGTTNGAITDFDGNFRIEKVGAGAYNLVVSYISYDSQIVRVELTNGQESVVNVELKPASVDIEEVNVVAKRRENTEVSLLSGLKAGNLIVSGISAQQISKSQDKDAAEVIRRVPGITITNGKFVIVRGLIERYNSVMLNGATAPSFEADKRAFSFDAIPSGLINNILIYKSPAPELPADFAGAAINIETKDVADENSLVISYSAGYTQNATFSKDFNTYQGSKTDWLGWDNGSRNIPAGVPDRQSFANLYDFSDAQANAQKFEDITSVSKLFSNNWETYTKSPFLDQSFSIASQRRFLLGKVTFGNLSAFNFGQTNTNIDRNRTEYQGLSEFTGEVDKDFDFKDVISSRNSKMGFIHNWNILYGNNQKLEFRNFLNQNGTSSTSIRNGINYYDGKTQRIYDLRFVSRMVYSGQLAGEQKFNQEQTSVKWMLGYGLTKNKQPDNRRLTYVQDKTDGSSFTDNYYLLIQNSPNVYDAGRLWSDMTEKIYDVKIDLEQKFKLFGTEKDWILKTGGFYEKKERSFNSRIIGAVAFRNTPFDMHNTATNLFVPENIFFRKTQPTQYGFTYKDVNRPEDSYNASDKIQAGYIGLQIPVLNKVTLYGGVRVEKFSRLITDFYVPTPTPELYDITRDTTNFFPSVNLSYNINEKHLIRASYGKTVNRPEFREMANFAYQDFDMFAIVHGNDTLQNAYINSYDLRYEWYPSLGEMVSVAAFYKDFSNPIEVFLIPAGTGYDYKPFNTEKAYSMGLELDVRKQLTELGSAAGFLHYLKDLTIIFNTSYIKSEIQTDLPFAREKHRIMQGQSPFIMNLGLNYLNPDNGLSVNLSYNTVGKRIAYVGSPVNPHTWELPRNSLDLTIQKRIGKRTTVKLGMKDILNDPVQFVQYYGAQDEIEVPTIYYVPNRQMTVGLSIKL